MKRTFTALLGLCLSLSAFSQHYWTEKTEFQRANGTTTFRSFTLDEAAVDEKLTQIQTLQKQGNNTANQTLEIPLPYGDYAVLELQYAPIMAEALAAKYPTIKTFTAKSKTDNIYGRVDFTYQGFHAMLTSTKGTIFIDNTNGNYIVYYKKDYYEAKGASQKFECEVDGATTETLKSNEPNVSAAGVISNGSQLRTYRLALACTGEYSNFHGGNKPQILSAMVTSINRVNSVYEREFSVHLELIANNDTLIFLNASNDPYTNNSGSTMLQQNINTVNSIIGSANYDIGHVFSTGGGGIAGLGVVCGNSKARGVTGSSAPVNDAFDIDYVAHEMGHQFGGNHTQNNNCNRNSSTAVEPGSASTIMGYAGICAPNLQNNSDDYFHGKSLDEIVTFITTGNGDNCPVKTATGNTIPSIAGDEMNNKTIPIGTPFELTANGTDADGDSLTYCWEQMDVGPSTTPTSPSGNAPMYRSFNPSGSETRVFPMLESILTGNLVVGEVYPNYTRSMNFTVTVRDNKPLHGAVNQANTKVNVTANAGPFVVNTPAQNDTVNANTLVLVKWDVANTDASPVSCATVNILLSTDGGYTYPTVLASNVANSGINYVSIPNGITSSDARIRVEANDNIFFNLSKSFVIEAFAPPASISEMEAQNNFKVYPNPATDQCFIVLKGIETDAFVTVTDVTGKQISIQKLAAQQLEAGFMTNTGHLPNGIYMVVVTAENGRSYKQRLVVNHQ